DNSNGGLWLAYTGQYGDARDRGAYVASAINDGPFFSLLFLGASGLADIPMIALVAALVPFLLGVVVGNLDPKWRDVLKPVPNIVIPFFAFALGTGINLGAVVSGGVSGLVRNGARIRIDIPARRIDLLLDEATLAQRRTDADTRGWKPRAPRPRKVTSALK
uniref:2-keto-3-deoxygluconate permease n=1 Tax=Escherichia coli TaxID=562 RepID=UPI00191BD21E